MPVLFIPHVSLPVIVTFGFLSLEAVRCLFLGSWCFGHPRFFFLFGVWYARGYFHTVQIKYQVVAALHILCDVDLSVM